MIEIDFKDLCIFEQLLKDKLISLFRGIELANHNKESHLYETLSSDFSLYFSLYEEISEKLLKLRSTK